MHTRSPSLLFAACSVAALLLAGLWFAGAERSAPDGTGTSPAGRVESALGPSPAEPGVHSAPSAPDRPDPVDLPRTAGSERRNATRRTLAGDSRMGQSNDRAGRLELPVGVPADERFRLSVSFPPSEAPPRAVPVAESGEFVVRDAPPGPIRFTLAAHYLQLPSSGAEEVEGVFVLSPVLHARLIGTVDVAWSSEAGAGLGLDADADAGEERIVYVGQLPSENEVLTARKWGGVSDRPRNLAVATIEAGGEFSVDQVPPNVPLVVEAHTPGGLPAREVLTLVPGETRSVRLVPEPAASLRGRLRVAGGSDPEAYSLRFHRRLDSSEPARTGRAASRQAHAVWGAVGTLRIDEPDGAFHIAGLHPGRYRVEAVGPSHAELEFDLPRGHTEGLLIEVDVPATIEGRVVWEDGSPLESVGLGEVDLVVRPECPGISSIWRKSGEFRLNGLAAGTRYELSATGLSPGSRCTVTSDSALVRAPATGIELRLPLPATVHGVVLFSEGVPVAGARVVLSGGGTVAVAADETFQIAAAPGQVVLSAAVDLRGGPSFSSSPLSLELAPGEVRKGVVLRLEGQAPTLRAVVVDALGQPVADAKFDVELVYGWDGARLGGGATTDADGAFELIGLWPGRARIHAELTRSRPYVQGDGEPLPFLFADDGTLVLPAEPRDVKPADVSLEPGEACDVELVLEAWS